MDKADIHNLLNKVSQGEISPADAETLLKIKPFEDLGFAKPDFHRSLRQGVAEVIFGSGKTTVQIIKIARSLLQNGQKIVLVTRINQDVSAHLEAEFSEYYYNDDGKIAVIGELPPPRTKGTVLIITAGTSDIPVAEEAFVTSTALGNRTERIYDAGVAGLHRLLARVDDIMTAKVIIAVAGMEGALASVVGGLASCPVIAVPTSVGYGASFGGVSALLSMLNSCASGVSVVNIDNGFGAAFQASLINHIGE